MASDNLNEEEFKKAKEEMVRLAGVTLEERERVKSEEEKVLMFFSVFAILLSLAIDLLALIGASIGFYFIIEYGAVGYFIIAAVLFLLLISFIHLIRLRRRFRK